MDEPAGPAPARVAQDMLTAVFDICMPMMRGAPLEATSGYAAWAAQFRTCNRSGSPG